MRDLARMFSLLRPYWGKLAIAALASGAFTAFKVKLVTLIRPIIDVELNPTASPATYSLGLPISALIVFLFLGSGLFSYVAQYLMHFVGQNVVAELRNKLFERIEFQPMAFFNTHSTGVLLSRMLSDIERIQLAVSEKVCDLMMGVLIVPAYLAVLLYLDATLAMVTLAAAPLVVFPIVKLGQKLRQVSHRSQEKMGELSTILHETVTGIRIVKAFCMESFELGKFKHATRKLVRVNLKAVRLVAIMPPLMEFLGGVAAGLVILYGIHKIRAGQLTTGSFTQFLVVLFMLYMPIKKLSRVNADLQQALAASERVFSIVDLPGEGQHAESTAALHPVKGEIEFENVCFAYEQEQVLQHINLKIPAGSVTALVGSSGAGKSTLASLIPRFYEPSQGRIVIDGIDIQGVALASVRAQIGLVSQEIVLFNDTVGNNVTAGRPDIPASDLMRALEAANALDFARELPEGLDTVIGEKGMRLSGGQRQRLAVARALLKNPPILILDEATSSLDAESELLVQEALGRLMEGRTVLVIAHRLSTVRKADLIVVIEGGRVVETGTHAELIRLKGSYYKYCALQDEEGIIVSKEEKC